MLLALHVVPVCAGAIHTSSHCNAFECKPLRVMQALPDERLYCNGGCSCTCLFCPELAFRKGLALFDSERRHVLHDVWHSKQEENVPLQMPLHWPAGQQQQGV